jgi:hypothetical protein
MSQVSSGYERKEHDLYPTPAWVTEVLIAHIERSCELRYGGVHECAAGEGMMADVLDAVPGMRPTYRSDIRHCAGLDLVGDFLTLDRSPRPNIITNPPFGQRGALAEQFIEHALRLTEDSVGMVAMLLRVDFDSAKTRRHLFGDNPAWSKKLVLTSRIKWFDMPPEPGKKKAGPSENHAWYIWDWKHEGPATIAYGGRS